MGFTKSRGDLALNGAVLVIHEPNRVFDDAGYAHRLDTATEALATHIRDGAGPRFRSCP